MSFYVIIGGLACVAAGTTLNAIATLITAVKGNQQENAADKRTLRVASAFLGFSILFIILTLIFLFIAMAAKQCKRSKIPLIIFASLAAICLIIPLVILRIYVVRKQRAGDTSSARDLRASFVLPLVGLGFFILGYVLLFAVLGKKVKRITRVCKNVNKARSMVPQQS